MAGMLRKFGIGLLGSAALAGSACAQAFGADPIAFDLGEDADAQVLIAAYQPPADAAPTFAGAGASQNAIAAEAGRPAPSIILGRIDPGREADFGIEALLPETVATMGFAFDDVETRVAMRGENPELFRALVEQGHIDPPENQLNAALQTELRRMNCYRSSIDGLWGGGSRRSVGQYFGEREDGTDWPDQNPSMELFRVIISYPDVACETPVAAPAPRATTNRTTRQQTTTSRPATTRRPAAPAPQPAAPARKPTISGGGGIGVFR